MDKSSHVFKVVDGLELKADVYRRGDEDGRPVMLFIHGGALMAGNRSNMSSRFRDRILGAGYVLVSIDYRLAPETKIDGIVEDVRDGHRWVREEGPRLFGCDPDRIAVSGGSAGGYLTLFAGYGLSPRPQALISIAGYANLLAEWNSKPNRLGHWHAGPIPREEAYRCLVDGPITDGMARPQPNRLPGYFLQQGTWSKEVTGFDSVTQADHVRAFCPINHVAAPFPPTLLIHGERDLDVPCAESVDMAGELERAGVENELVLVPNAGHGFHLEDLPEPMKVPVPVVAEVLERLVVFLKKHVPQ